MAKWRWLEYYAHGTSTRTTKRLRRLHLFTWDFKSSVGNSDAYKSCCGILVFENRLSKGADVQKCGHCLKHVEKGRR